MRVYKGFTINEAGDPRGWSPIEEQFHADLIDKCGPKSEGVLASKAYVDGLGVGGISETVPTWNPTITEMGTTPTVVKRAIKHGTLCSIWLSVTAGGTGITTGVPLITLPYEAEHQEQNGTGWMWWVCNVTAIQKSGLFVIDSTDWTKMRIENPIWAGATGYWDVDTKSKQFKGQFIYRTLI